MTAGQKAAPLQTDQGGMRGACGKASAETLCCQGPPRVWAGEPFLPQFPHEEMRGIVLPSLSDGWREVYMYVM